MCLAAPTASDAQNAAIAPEALDAYITRVARAWEPYTTSEGEVLDPLNPADTGDNYGVLMMADVILKAAARDNDAGLAETGERIVERAALLPVVEGPFNLLAIASLLRDGQRGLFPPAVWTQISAAIEGLAGRIAPASSPNCLTDPSCYSNWRLVWSAGASELLASDAKAGPGATGSDPGATSAEIVADLSMARAHAGTPASPSAIPGAGELSDPGTEPPSYHLFSCALLELIAEANPGAISPAVEGLREAAAHYALQLMAPDGQLSFAGRSLDQSWVQATGAALGARQAALDPAHAAAWRSFADRAFSYLESAYPALPNGIIPIVPGLAVDWDPSIVDSYAALNQYEGLTLWFLSDALEHWPAAAAARATIPSDSSMLVGDLDSSGLVWGRSGRVWWAVSGRQTGSDPRSAQGLVALKLQTVSGWRDLLALRPEETGLSSAWTLTVPGGRTGLPVFTTVRGDGRRVVLTGTYRGTSGARLGRAVWTLTATERGLRLAMARPRRSRLRATVWLADSAARLSAGAARTSGGACGVTASGRACPTTLYWTVGVASALELGA